MRTAIERQGGAAAALLILLVAAGACRSGGARGPEGTVANDSCNHWPAWSGPSPALPSLGGDAGKVLSRQRLAKETRWKRLRWGEGVVLAGGQVLFTWDGALCQSSLGSSAPTRLWSSESQRPLSAPALDRQGRVYVASYTDAYALDAQGKLRWHAPLEVPKDLAEFAEIGIQMRPFVVAPDGSVYLASVARRVHAWTPEGTERWNVPIPGNPPAGQPAVSAGAGDLLLVDEQGSEVGLYDVRDGRRTAIQLRTADGRPLGVVDNSWTLGYRWGITLGWFPFDPCGRIRPPLEGTANIRRLPITTTGDMLVETAWTTEDNGVRTGPNSLYLWTLDGVRRAGPAAVPGIPVAAGADGSIYTVACDEEGEQAVVHATFADLKPSWRLEIGGRCPTGNVVLTDEGVLWLLHRSAEGDGELLAIQTSSPGLAHSSWPSRRHDNAGTSWLPHGPR